MKIGFFSTKPYDRTYFDAANREAGHELSYFEAPLRAETAVLAGDAQAVCGFVNDTLDRAVLEKLADQGIRLVTLRSAGFNHVDLEAAEALGITVARVPAYSPHAVAEHTLALVLALNRRIHKAHNRVRENNFNLDGLIGFDLNEKTVGIIGTGQIGAITAGIFQGFNCRVIAYDVAPDPDCEARGIAYVDLDTLFAQSDIISLHCPLTPQTRHLIGTEAIAKMKPGVMIANTSRGAVIDTPAVLEALKDGRIGALALDVYEEEGDLFFRDLSNDILSDDVFARLLTFPNVLITGHQAFFTHEALTNIAETTLGNVTSFEKTGAAEHTVSVENVV
ncbi:MAG: D-lactate dehydrogenase [Saliniramus fredricksonii]|uniref:D-lactate dehydrogenase n=1 Tax=Saliniramus fredricksonii TaxID=1653334 RepID=A0A0N8KDI5_9HYPH|nr:2-hydroxyacid dehydrogenase [Saliniramus fredricksonii]KPQ08634.1 MAG: D-lactate dehydrogenase [Saliniramus fredricksonii]SCC78377.1 D-lactate dehydrogenase [Saliniramus fredricksonii]